MGEREKKVEEEIKEKHDPEGKGNQNKFLWRWKKKSTFIVCQSTFGGERENNAHKI